ncbi:MAG: potassium channel family protein [Desulfobacterales bacterium]|nr:potassium channel family protein [Desulfobacterales bacterium]
MNGFESVFAVRIMNNTRHLVVSSILSLVILMVGTAGYMIIEEWTFLDALYMTVITISTVGYREINQVGDVGRIFTIILVAIGVGFTLYVAAAVVQFMVEGRIRIILGRRRLDQKLNRLKNHYFDYHRNKEAEWGHALQPVIRGGYHA